VKLLERHEIPNAINVARVKPPVSQFFFRVPCQYLVSKTISMSHSIEQASRPYDKRVRSLPRMSSRSKCRRISETATMARAALCMPQIFRFWNISSLSRTIRPCYFSSSRSVARIYSIGCSASHF
jgi:hypothetical protein